MEDDKRHVERGLLEISKFTDSIDDQISRFRRDAGLLGNCAICKLDGELCQDHDHDNGLNRGRICRKCNFGLGFLRDDTAVLDRAIEYLRRWRAIHSNLTTRAKKEMRYKKWDYKRKNATKKKSK